MISTPSCTTGVRVSLKMARTPFGLSWIPTVSWDKEMASLAWMLMRSAHSMIAQVSERVSSGKKNNATLYHRIKNNLQLKNLFNRPFRDATTILNSVVSKSYDGMLRGKLVNQ